MGTYKPDNYSTLQHPDSPPPPEERKVVNVLHVYSMEITYKKLIKGTVFCFSIASMDFGKKPTSRYI